MSARIPRHAGRHRLENRVAKSSYEAVEFNILSLVDHTHTTTAELFEDAIVGNGLPDKRLRIRHLRSS